MPRSCCVPFLAGAAFTVAITTARPSAADPKVQDVGAAQALFQQASTELDKKQYATACPKLEEVVRVVPRAIGAKLALAECYEGLGRVASAWSMWGEAAAEASTARQAAREKQARTRAQALEKRLPRLVILVAQEVAKLPELHIERDGVEVGEAQWNVPLPVDPGAHRISATAQGKIAFERTATAMEGATAEVGVDVLADAPRPPSKNLGLAPIREEPARPSSVRTVGWIGVGVGAAGLAVGSVFGVAAIVSKGAEGDNCHGDVCNSPGKTQRLTTRSFGNVSTIAFIAGGVVAAAGLTLVIAAPKSQSRTALVLSPSAIALRGVF